MGKHKHAEVIKAWADGAEIQYEDCGWHDCGDCDILWDLNTQYRIKPVAPKWPETTMTDDALALIYMEADPGTSRNSDFIAVANAAIAHALETGLVVLP